jgi:mitochondrial fission protein ELM1
VLIIAAGRGAATVALALKGEAPRIALLSPRVNPRHFELVLAPAHDGLTGDNVISYPGALHRITPSIRGDFPPPPEAFITLLLGGNSKHHTYTAADITRLCDEIKHLRTLPPFTQARLLITPSRRTHPGLLTQLKGELGDAIAELWDGTGENPYRRYLAWAKAIVATGDSINMMAEACGLGKPVFIFQLPTARSGKLARFGRTLLTGGHAQPLHAPDVTAAFRPLNPFADIHERVQTAIHKLINP